MQARQREFLELLSYFRYDHLPERLQAISRPFGMLAIEVANRRPGNHQTVLALTHLLQAKDAAVRAALELPGGAA